MSDDNKILTDKEINQESLKAGMVFGSLGLFLSSFFGAKVLKIPSKLNVVSSVGKCNSTIWQSC
ncbi:hypothetical protein H4219_000856 [Mycoemilia scoparia]|uniref:Uncharacterized protein n=1 Tax=Mycoemilia scoparia TaxID=417184 RepID=A0A9W8DR63_9FUNG|nr:hypothetical protein H4219_000856 [Mycoemilia scoparia]